MRKITALLVFCVAMVVSQAQEKTYKIVNIGFYNLENLFDTLNDPEKNDEDFLPTGANGNTPAVYKDKLGKLSDVISLMGMEQSPDGMALLGVAEVENRKVLEDLVSQPKLAGRHYQIVHYNSPDIRSIDVGLLYNPKYFKPLHSQSMFVKLVEPDGSLRYTRDVLWVSGKLDGETVHVFVNHWPSRRGGEDASNISRVAAATVAKKVIDSLMLADPNTKVILMGDLNDDPVNESVAKVIGAKGDAKKVREGGMFNPWMDMYSKGIGTLAYNDSWNLFDQVLISYGFLKKEQTGLFFKKAQIFKKGFMVADSGRYKGYPMRTYDGVKYMGGYSDHFPTYCVFLKEVVNP